MKTIVGLYEDLAIANQVVQALVHKGTSRDAISLVTRDHERAYASPEKYETGGDGQTIDTGNATAGGAVTGAVIGGMGGVLLSLGALAIPGIGPVIAVGPLIAGLVGAGAGAAVGSLLGALTEVGIPEEEAGYYVEGVNRGGTLVSVQTDDAETDQVVEIMNRYSPIDVKERVSSWRSGAPPDYGDSLSTDVSGRMDEEGSRFAAQMIAGQPTPAETEQQPDHVIDHHIADP